MRSQPTLVAFLGLALALVLAGVLAGGCGDSSGSAQAFGAGEGGGGVVRVVASTSVIADWLGEIGGDRLAITTLAAGGADVHTVQLAPGAVIAIAAADLVVLNGAGLEAAFADVVNENAAGVVLTLAESIAIEPFSGSTAPDPHFWLDAELAATAVGLIGGALSEVDPAGAVGYRDNLARYAAAIAEVDAEVGAALAALPAERRQLVTFHNAFGYFARRYGLRVAGFVSGGPESEPSAQAIAELIQTVEASEADRIFTEPQFRSSVLEQVAREAGVSIRTLHSQLSEAAPNYLALLRLNARALTG